MERDFVRFQADHHPLIQADGFQSMEEYCLHLIHLKAYEEAANFGRDKAVLDLGCNNGYGTRVIAGSSRRVVGVDVSEPAIVEAQRLGRANNLSFLRVTGNELPFQDGEFDVVASFQVIEHIPDYRPYLSEIGRVLKSAGIAVFTTPNARIRLDPGMKPWFPFHVREFSAEELGELLAQWFPKVQIKGLFAAPDMYQIEYDRVQRSRAKARRRASALFPPYVELRTNVINAAKSVMPPRLVKEVQAVIRNLISKNGKADPAPQSHLDAKALSRFSTKDLHYAEQNLDQALDLMAVCYSGTKGQ